MFIEYTVHGAMLKLLTEFLLPRRNVVLSSNSCFFCSLQENSELSSNKNGQGSVTISTIANLLKCKQAEAERLYHKLPITIRSDLTAIERRILILSKRRITIETLIQNSWLLSTDKLASKLIILQLMKWRNINDFVPMLKMDPKLLNQIHYSCSQDQHQLPKGFEHRIYYFSDQLQAQPEVIAQWFSKHNFMLTYKFEFLDKQLKTFLSYNIKPQNILQDLSAFRASPEVILERLEYVQAADVKPIMPWMIRCLESTLKRFVQDRLNEKATLGNHLSIDGYLAERLNLNDEELQKMLKQCPRLRSRNVIQIKEVLDFLLNETQYTQEEIATTPRILLFSLNTIRNRIEQIDQLQCGYVNLSNLTQGTDRFNKLIQRQTRYSFDKENS